MRLIPCPTCGVMWPHPHIETPTRDADIDWTCSICLHAEIAALKRQTRLQVKEAQAVLDVLQMIIHNEEPIGDGYTRVCTLDIEAAAAMLDRIGGGLR